MDHLLTIKIPIKWDQMSGYEQLRFVTRRSYDSQVIYRTLGIIKHEHDIIVSGTSSGKFKINEGKLDAMTLTTRQRKNVPYNLKKEFPRASHDELQECRKTAVAIYKSYLELTKIQDNARLPVDKPKEERGIIPRTIFHSDRGCLDIDLENSKLILRDSLDSNWSAVNRGKDYARHDKLHIPIKLSKYHLEQIQKGRIVSMNISHKNGQFTANLSVKCEVKGLGVGKILAVLGIDLGIKKTAYTALLTVSGIQFRRTWHSDEKFEELARLEHQVADLQGEYWRRKNNHLPQGNIHKKLDELRHQRERVSREYDRILVKELSEHLLELSKKFDLKVGIGDLSGIRTKGKKGNYRGRKYRKMLNSWAFFRFTKMLEHKLSEMGLKNILLPVKEYWTSQMCYKCNTRGLRPKQSLFICKNCNIHNNADFNGAMNIAKRVVVKRKLIPVSSWGCPGLGRYLPRYGNKVTPKAPRGSPGVFRNKVSSVSAPVVSGNNPGNDHAIVKKYGKTVSRKKTTSVKQSRKKRPPP